MKKCCRCGIDKSIDEFQVCRANKDGRQYSCRQCANAATRASRLKREARVHGPDCSCTTCRAGEKHCRICDITKPLAAFNAWRSGVDGLQRECRSCQKVSVRKSRYKIDEDTFRQRLSSQNGRCAACGEKLTDENIRVDHNHQCCPGQSSCGKCVRGLLCAGCNVALGMLKDDPNRALALATYLMRFESVLQEEGGPTWD